MRRCASRPSTRRGPRPCLRAVRFRWEGSGARSTAYVRYEANELPDTARWQSLRGVLVAGSHTVFYATPVGGSLGVYVGRETPQRIAGLGDPAFGSGIADLALNPVSIHRAGWLAMRLALEDGTERIVRFALHSVS